MHSSANAGDSVVSPSAFARAAREKSGGQRRMVHVDDVDD
jgi:hypothetical protein